MYLAPNEACSNDYDIHAGLPRRGRNAPQNLCKHLLNDHGNSIKACRGRVVGP